MKNLLLSLLLVGLTGCAFGALKPGKGSVLKKDGTTVAFQQSENPQAESSQIYEKVTVWVPAEEAVGFPVGAVLRASEKVTTTIGAAQKDTAREVAAKLSSLKGVVWVGVLVFLFGAASAFWPPLKVIVGSVTTSAIACVAGLALIVLPSLIAGNEILILCGGIGAVVLYFFAHRHASVHAKAKANGSQ